MSPVSRHRNGRKKAARSLRREANNLRRQLRRTATSGKQTYATLLAVLAQSGGEVTITQGTIDQVGQNFDQLGFVVVKKDEPANEYVVRLVEGQEETHVEHDHDETVSDGESLAGDSPVVEKLNEAVEANDSLAAQHFSSILREHGHGEHDLI